MQKKISFWAAAAVALLSAVVAVLATVLVYRSFYGAEVTALNNSYSEAVEELNKTYEDRLNAVNEQISEYGEIAADLREIDEIYRALYPNELDEDALRNYVLKGYVAGAGDRYGFYYSPEEAEAVLADVNGESDGIGINVIYDAEVGCIEVISVNPDSPAEEAGMLAGDYISYVIDDNGGEVAVAEIGYDVALTMLRGEAGTEAKFIVLRDEDGDGVYSDHEFAIERAKIESVSISYRLYEPDNTVGVIKITGFDRKTPEQFKEAVEALRADGAEKLVFDVRSNPGGDKDAVCEILDYILPEGPILRTYDADSEDPYKIEAVSDENYLDMPMAVVMNGDTASAAELFAASIKDYEMGKLVGETTFGKGSMQSIMPVFDDGSLLRITTSLYCPPKTDNYDGVGVIPDTEVPIDEALSGKNPFKYTDAEDNQLRAAVETFE